MHEKPKSIGEIFRLKREEMHLSFKEIENATSIRISYLQAIEEGRITHCLSSAYALGFTRQYASFLGIDAEQLAREYPDSFRLPQEKQDFAYGIGTLEMRSSPQAAGRWMPNVVWGIGFVALLFATWYFARFMGLF